MLFNNMAYLPVKSGRQPNIERFYDADGNETEVLKIIAGSETPGVVVEKGRYHSLEATDEMGVVCGVKAGHFQPLKSEDIISK